MVPTRVLVVDDSVVIRHLVTNILAAEPGIEVVGTAANGRIALSKLAELRPDVITLDIEMPELDGIETLAALRELRITIPVIMFSTMTAQGAAATLEALALGAADYVTKPSGASGIAAAGERVREVLVPRINALAQMARHRRRMRADGEHRLGADPWRAADPVTALGEQEEATDEHGTLVLRRAPLAPARVEVVALGVSTGGPNALSEIIPALPSSLTTPVVVVQHMPVLFTRLLAERLDARSGLRVQEATEAGPLRPGHVYLAPGGAHLVLERRDGEVWTAVDHSPPENSCRPSVDRLFRSVAEIYGPGALGVVLTGMGQDGLAGAAAICARGGRMLVQDEASSVVWGMPGAVVRAGHAEKIVPLAGLAAEIVDRVPLGPGRDASTQP